MTLPSGRRLGPYEILAPLGAGGMGEVYRARDTRLDRDVAAKILPELFTADRDRLARFEREAKVLASLNHPNIAQIYGIENSNGLSALVMEFVDGEDLSQRLTRAAIPVAEALDIARQIADALEAAHERGIIHRDLKPANIKVREDGTVKVLDFGLAKAMDSGPIDAALSPTFTSPATQVGVLLGTAAYMAPEQARGKAVDKRADIWAFGVVVYEMLTGSSAFPGETVTDVLAHIVGRDADWTLLPAETPAGVRRVLRRCLERDPKRRVRDIADVRYELEEAHKPSADSLADGEARASVLASIASRRRERIAWIAAVAVVALIAAAAILWRGRSQAILPTPSEVRLEITTPVTPDPISLAISPDGRKVIFVASPDGVPKLWVRSVESGSSRPLAGTDGASYPFWSPDSRSVAFFAEQKLKRTDIDGGSVQTLASAAFGQGGTWNQDGVILFVFSPNTPISRIPATASSPPEPLALPHRAALHLPQFLPDGRHFIYHLTAAPGVGGVYFSTLGASDSRRILDADSAAVYAPSGYLLFARRGVLFAQQFDPIKGELSGNAFQIAENVGAGTNVAALSVSMAGPIVYRAASSSGQTRLAWFNRSGKELRQVIGPEVSGATPALSPDGHSVVMSREADIWLVDENRGVLNRLTSDPGPEVFPQWSSTGKDVVYSAATREGLVNFSLFLKAADGASPTRLLLTVEETAVAMDWSSDGRHLLYRTRTDERGWDVWALPIGGAAKPFPVVQTRFDERDAQFSWDGKWIAYQSNKSERFEVYLQPFPGTGNETRVSTTGGTQPRWNRNGKELFYIASDGRLMSVPIKFPAERRVAVGTPVPLFYAKVGVLVRGGAAHQYNVSADGQRFLINRVTEEGAAPITMILNWKPGS